VNNALISTVSVGHTTLDRYGPQLLPGGSAWYGARVFAALGARATLITAVGADFQGNEAAFAGLEAIVARGPHSTLFTNEHDASGRRTQYIETEAPPVTPDQLRANEPGTPARSGVLLTERGGAWGAPVPPNTIDILFLAPVFGEVPLQAWKSALDARLVCVGAQGWLKTRGERVPGRPGASRVVPADWPAEPALLRGVDVACLSAEDVAGREHLLDRICGAVPLVALTLGKRGCLLLQGGRETHVPVFPAREVDPTGAGDTFAAGMLHGLACGLDPLDAARRGAWCAARVVEGLGGENLSAISLPTLGA
jgi:hypothetical protein